MSNPAASLPDSDSPDDSTEEVILAEAVPEKNGQQAARMYVVPQQFGMSAILGIITALALLFGILQRLNALPVSYLFFGVLGLVICLVQMFFGKVPRMASVVTGMVVFGLFVLASPLYIRRIDLFEVACLLVGTLPVGGFLGYLAGTCAAGIFLVMDYLEHYLKHRHGAPRGHNPLDHDSPAASTPGGA